MHNDNQSARFSWVRNLLRRKANERPSEPSHHYDEEPHPPKRRDLSARMLPLFGACPYMRASDQRKRR